MYVIGLKNTPAQFNCKLHQFKLGNYNLCQDSEISKALALNCTLTHLELYGNHICNTGGLALLEALNVNSIIID